MWSAVSAIIGVIAAASTAQAEALLDAQRVKRVDCFLLDVLHMCSPWQSSKLQPTSPSFPPHTSPAPHLQVRAKRLLKKSEVLRAELGQQLENTWRSFTVSENPCTVKNITLHYPCTVSALCFTVTALPWQESTCRSMCLHQAMQD